MSKLGDSSSIPRDALALYPWSFSFGWCRANKQGSSAVTIHVGVWMYEIRMQGFDCTPMLYTYNGRGINYVSKLDDSDTKQQQGGRVSYVSSASLR